MDVHKKKKWKKITGRRSNASASSDVRSRNHLFLDFYHYFNSFHRYAKNYMQLFNGFQDYSKNFMGMRGVAEVIEVNFIGIKGVSEGIEVI